MFKNISSFILIIVLYSNILFARELMVPQDYNTIQNAINVAGQQDVIIVGPGIFCENIHSSHPVQIQGLCPERTIIKGGIKITNEDSNSLSQNKSVIKNLCVIAKKIGIEVSDNCDVLVENCIIKNAPVYGVNLYNNRQSTVRNCRIRNCLKLGLNCYNLNNVSITNNIITDNGDPNQNNRNGGEGIEVYDTKQCTLIGNTSSNNKTEGIYLTRVDNSIIKNNKCNGNEEVGIYLYNCSYSTISNNKTMVNLTGILIYRADGLIENNISINNRQNGIFVRASEEDATETSIDPNKINWSKVKTRIVNNCCTNNDLRGIYLYYWKHLAVLEKNVCEYNKSNGIEVEKTFQQIHILENICKYNSEQGLDLYETAYILADKNILKRNGGRGILIQNTKDYADISNNTIESNNYYGIDVQDGGNAVITSNQIEKNNCEGVIVNGEQNATAKIIRNIIKDNYPVGIIFINGAAGEIKDNECSGHAWSGIAIRGKGTNPVVSGNKCFNNKCWGIAYWDEAKPSIAKDNIMKNNALGGIKKKQLPFTIDYGL